MSLISIYSPQKNTNNKFKKITFKQKASKLSMQANLDLYTAFMAIEQLFSVPHLLSHGAFVCNCLLQGTETHKPFGECLAVDLSLPIL